MFVSVGSHSNDDDSDNNPVEHHRADILEFNPDGSGGRVYAWGIRNPVGIAVNPVTGVLWASVNERDGLGDNLVPDYITHVQEGGFYGWPWFYIGGHWDPRQQGKHPELQSKVVVPDVLLQPHNASLEMTFYDGRQFPAEYDGDIFAGEHGSWNRATRAGYEVIRVPMKDGHATGEYEDFLTGFVTPNGGRVGPAGGSGRGPGWIVDRDRRRIQHGLESRLRCQIRWGGTPVLQRVSRPASASRANPARAAAAGFSAPLSALADRPPQNGDGELKFAAAR